MKKKTTPIKLSMFKYLLFLPILLLSFCESNFEEFSLSSENKLTKDAKVLSLMKSAVQSDLNKTVLKSEDVVEDDQCTHFLYDDMAFEVYSGDDPTPKRWEINSDEELISFIDILTASLTTYEFYILFPITLLDTDGVPTVLNDLTELEGTLQMAVDACESFTDDSSEDNDDDSDNDDSNNDDSADNGSDDGSDNGSSDGSDDSSNDGSDDDDNITDDDNGDVSGSGNDTGIHNAHFDVDTSHLIYDFNDGKTDAHTHRYDDKYNTNIVDYFNILNDDKKKKKGLRNINDLEFGVPNDSEQFYIIIANANLSQAVQLEINGDLISVMDYQKKVHAYLNGDSDALEAYSLGNSKDATKLTSLKFIVGLDAANINNGLIPTETKTVVKNTPGPNGEYRDGALIIQAININNMSLNSNLGVAKHSADLYWESTIFWHIKQSGDDKRNDNDDYGDYEYCHKKNKKVYICHKGKTICVSVNAIWGHLTHHEDDYLGSCEE